MVSVRWSGLVYAGESLYIGVHLSLYIVASG